MRSPHRPGRIVRVVLVGFMAAGKTTIGRLLADRLDWEFVDFDAEIERRAEMTVPEIFRRHGEAAFRDWEDALTRELAGVEYAVLAPGGGWITQPRLLDCFGPETLVVWLRISPEEAAARAERTLSHRPLLAAAPDPLERARLLIREREPLYRLADVAIDVDGREPEALALRIAEMVEN